MKSLSKSNSTTLFVLLFSGSMFPNVESLVDSLYDWEQMQQENVKTDDEDEEDVNNVANQDTGESSSEQDDELAAQSATAHPAEHKSKKKKRRQNKKKQQISPEAVQINVGKLIDEDLTDIVKLQDEIRRMTDARLCKVCMDNEISIVFLTCRHMACCVDCAPAVRHCPICRETIRGTIRAFLS